MVAGACSQATGRKWESTIGERRPSAPLGAPVQVVKARYTFRMAGPGTGITLATVIRITSPSRLIPTPPFARQEVILLWGMGILFVCLGLAALGAIVASSEVRRRRYALVPLVAGGIVTLVMGATLLVNMA
jgi:hypothetical protein